jgi:ligand-binding sensor domain-containing protein/AraC-like DNA-binding protein
VLLSVWTAAILMHADAAVQEPGSQRYIVTAWTIENGLPQNSVLSLVQCRRGYIWLGTRSGLVRFDGASFRVFNRWNSTGLKNDRILYLFEDSSGTLWVGTDGGGVSRLKDGEWSILTTKQGLSHNTVRAISEDKEHNLWVGTDNGLNRIKNGKIDRFTMDDGLSGLSVTALAPGKESVLWIGTASGGLSRMKEGKFRLIPFQKKIGGNSGAITSLFEDRVGVLWIGTENGLFVLQNNPSRRAALEDRGRRNLLNPLPDIPVQALMEDRDGTLWVGTEGDGLYRWEKKKFIPVTARQGLPDFFIYSLLNDREGNLWLGTYTAGLIRLKRPVVDTLSRENGLPEDRVHTVFRDGAGHLWIGTNRSGVVRVNRDSLRVDRKISSVEGLTDNRVKSLWIDEDDTLWIGTGTGLNRMGNGSIRTYTRADGLSANNITAIYRDRSGSLWIGTGSGLNRWSGPDGTFDVYKQGAGLRSTHIRTILENRQGSLLLGTRAGIFLLEQESGTLRDLVSAPPEERFDHDVLALYEDPHGILWVGTNGSGLVRIETGTENDKPIKPVFFTGSDGLPNNYIFSISGDDKGNLWMSSYRGVFRVSIDALNRLAGQREQGTATHTITAVSFDEKEGMNSSECALEGRPAACITPDGMLYIPTLRGVAVFNAGAFVAAPDPPPVIIENVIADNKQVIFEKNRGESFPADTSVLEFYFTALSFTSPGKVRMRYKLEGYDSEWHEVSPRQQRTALYLNLPGGNYTFRVTACGNNGSWNPEGARFTFKIGAPVYLQPLFYVLTTLLLVIFVLGIGLLLRSRRNRRLRAVSRTKPGTAPAEAEEEQAREKYKTSALLPETVEAVLPKLKRLMEEEKLFLDPELNLKQLAQKLHVHYNHLSRIINEHIGKSFNDYVNSYRIQEARKRLSDSSPVAAKKTVLEIAYDTGFYSKSVFNTAFKKFTGMTPSQFRKKNR